MNKLFTLIFFINSISIPLIAEISVGSVLLFVINIFCMAYFASGIFDD